MTTRIAIILVLIFAAALLADHLWLDGGLPLYLLRQFTLLVNWVTFWD